MSDLEKMVIFFEDALVNAKYVKIKLKNGVVFIGLPISLDDGEDDLRYHFNLPDGKLKLAMLDDIESYELAEKNAMEPAA